MTTPLGSYAEWQLARPSTPQAELADLVRRAVGSEAIRLDRILEGYSNEVYRVRCADGQEVVVRVRRFDDDVTAATSAREAAAIEQARAGGVPAPEVLLLDTVSVDGETFPAMVQRTVSGVPAAAVIDRLSRRQRGAVLVGIGRLIAHLTAIVIEGEVDWPTAMAVELADRSAGRDTIIAGGFGASEVDRMLDLLAAYIRDFPCQQWVLCHGDLSLKHLFVAGAGTEVGVCGVIDFGDWRPGAPVHDLAVLRVREPQLDLRPLLAGYGANADPNFRRRLDLHTLLIALDALAFHVHEDDGDGVARSARQIRSLVERLAER